MAAGAVAIAVLDKRLGDLDRGLGKGNTASSLVLEREHLPEQRGLRAISKLRATALAISFNPDRPDPEPEEPDTMIWRTAAQLARWKARLAVPAPSKPKVALNPRDELFRMRTSRKWLIDPRTSRFASSWDGVTTVAIFFVAIITPYEVCFLRSAKTFADPLFIINRFVDMVFVFDLLLNFFLMYTTFDVRVGRLWVEDHPTIIHHYLTGWFTIDLLSTLVSAFDIMGVAMEDSGGGSGNVQSLKMVKMVRGLRLVKLLRLLRGSRIFRRFETKMSIRYSTLDLLKCAAFVIAASHWSACCWGMLAAPLFVDEPLDTWIGRYGYCRPLVSVFDADLFDDVRGQAVCVGPGRIYLAALYWAFLLVTNTGFSDLGFASEVSSNEQVVSIMVIFVAQTVWAHVLATFTGILLSSDPHTRDFRHNMDQLNRFMKEQPTSIISTNTRQRLREYMHQSRHIMIDASNKQLIELMSPALQGEVAFKINKIWLERVPFLRDAEPAFMVALALELTPMVFAPGEEPMHGFLYIVHRGLALHGGKVLSAGKVWGEDMILFCAELRTINSAKAMNYLEVHMIGREELLDLAVLYPRSYRRLRRQIGLLALRRGIIKQAKTVLRIHESDLLADRGKATGSRQGHGPFRLENALSAATQKSADEREQEVYRTNLLSGLGTSGVLLCASTNGNGPTAAAERSGVQGAAASIAQQPSGAAAGALAASPTEGLGAPHDALQQAATELQGGGDLVRTLLSAVQALRQEVAVMHKEQQEAAAQPRQRLRMAQQQRSGVGGARPEPRRRQRLHTNNGASASASGHDAASATSFLRSHATGAAVTSTAARNVSQENLTSYLQDAAARDAAIATFAQAAGGAQPLEA